MDHNLQNQINSLQQKVI